MDVTTQSGSVLVYASCSSLLTDHTLFCIQNCPRLCDRWYLGSGRGPLLSWGLALPERLTVAHPQLRDLWTPRGLGATVYFALRMVLEVSCAIAEGKGKGLSDASIVSV